MTTDPQPPAEPTPAEAPARARDTGPLAAPLPPAPGATADLTAAMIRRGAAPPPPPAEPKQD